MSFLSVNNQFKLEVESNNFLYPLWMNGSLVLVFILQHSWLKTNQIKGYLNKLKINPSTARCIYVMFTSIALQIVMICWSPVRSYNLWKIEITENSVTSFIFSSSEFLAWVFIYGGSLLLDFPELVGVKQVYYNCINIHESSDLKSSELQRLYSHKRHPSFIGFLVVLWVTPVMSLDRILLASILSLYTLTAWDPTLEDKRYHERQLIQKKQEIEYNYRRSATSETRSYWIYAPFFWNSLLKCQALFSITTINNATKYNFIFIICLYIYDFQ